jgi:selenocysteine-specific translation elongation factor
VGTIKVVRIGTVIIGTVITGTVKIGNVKIGKDNFILAETSARIRLNFCYSGRRISLRLPLIYLPMFAL